MSSTTKAKHVVNEALQRYELPDEKNYIVKVIAPRGNNLHEVITPSGSTFLVTMPTKFRRTIFIKRGDYVLVENIDEGDKVKAEIIQILLKDNIKYIRAQNCWPKEFEVIQDEENKDNGSYEDMMPPSQSSGDEEEEEEEEEEPKSILHDN
ncbi:unnamed protein product [Adineta steineri]|uniref:Probable RNA-binding protein EIF1AD n=1 Tax=Adineta steineri TaxID=433720 RepID=A0A815P7U0_9BILA|nr:unnamed protein product [Adineta steineri]